MRAGETLSQIAQRYHVTVDALVQANGIRNPDLVLFGQTLKIPAVVELRPPVKAQVLGLTPQKVLVAQATTTSPAPAAQGPEGVPDDWKTALLAIGRVSNVDGVDLHTQALPNSPITKRLPFNTRLFVGGELPKDWYFVALEDGSFGYVYTKFVILHPPEPAAVLHKIKRLEGALAIVKQYYKGDAIKWGQDERFYVNVLVEANSAKNPSGIYKPTADADWSKTEHVRAISSGSRVSRSPTA